MALKKSLVCVMSVLVAAIVAAPIAEAQIGGIIGGILGNIMRIQGTIFCTLNGRIGVNGTSTPVFPSKICIFKFSICFNAFYVKLCVLF